MAMFSIRHLGTNEHLLESMNTYANQEYLVIETATSQDKCGFDDALFRCSDKEKSIIMQNK